MKYTCIIIPIYNEEHNIGLLVNSIQDYVKTNYEIIFVDDGSSDDSLLEIKKLALLNTKIKCISFSRNFGHQNALMAGLQHAQGDFFVIMDGDGQHPPQLIPAMLEKLNNGFDLINTNRIKTEEINIFKKIVTKFFYVFINTISDTSIKPNHADFRAFNKKALDGILQFKETELFLRGIFNWIGFKTTTIQFVAPARIHGKTKYSLKKMSRLAVRGITSFSTKPLRLALLIGSFVSFVSFSFGVFAVIDYFMGKTVHGWPSLIIAIMFLGGVQLLTIGLLGEYIAGIFIEAKKRPLYLINEKINIDHKSFNNE